MKNLYSYLFVLMCSSCLFSEAQEIINTTSENNEASYLVSKVLEQLNMNYNDCYAEFIVEHQMPNDPQKTIIILPVLNSSSNEDYIILDAYILIVQNKTEQILHTFFKERFWESDAVILDQIIIESTPYKLSKKDVAFGVRTHYHTNSQPNPYAEEDISLFLLKEDKLLMILDSYQTLEYTAEWDMNCAGESLKITSEIVITDIATNGYYNLQVLETVQKRKTFMKNNECEEVLEVPEKVIKTLLFINDNYVEHP